jgi:hypothetical protein
MQLFKRTRDSSAELPDEGTDSISLPNGKRSKANPKVERDSDRGFSTKALSSRKSIAAAIRQDRRRHVTPITRPTPVNSLSSQSTPQKDDGASAASPVSDPDELPDYDTDSVPGEDLNSSPPVSPLTPAPKQKQQSQYDPRYALSPSDPNHLPTYISVFTDRDSDSEDENANIPIIIERPKVVYKSDIFKKRKIDAEMTRAKAARLAIMARIQRRDCKVGSERFGCKKPEETERVHVRERYVPTWYPREEEGEL